MFACIFLFVVLLPITVFASNIENLFSPDELASMGVCTAYTQDGSKVA